MTQPRAAPAVLQPPKAATLAAIEASSAMSCWPAACGLRPADRMIRERFVQAMKMVAEKIELKNMLVRG